MRALALENRRTLRIAVALLYFAQGFPYGFVAELMPIYLRTHGASLGEIGFLSTVGVAWSLKFLWAPAVDIFGSFRRWISGSLLLIGVAVVLLIPVMPAGGAFFWTVMAVIAVASATQDIAIDGLTVKLTPSSELGPVNGIRITTYRIAMIAAGAAFAWIAANTSWRIAFAGCVAICAILSLLALLLPDNAQVAAQQSHEGEPDLQSPATKSSNFLHGIRVWARRPRVVLIVAVVLLYRLGDAALTPMVKPFWIDRGFSTSEVGFATTLIGMTFTIAGGIAGGAFIKKFGLFTSLLALGVLQALSNGAYAAVALMNGGRAAVYSAAVIENLTGGLGTAAFLAFLMSLCDRERAATEFAFLSALFAITRMIAGTASGFLAERFGYASYFSWTIALGFPGLLLIFFIRDQIGESAEDATSPRLSTS